MRWATPPSGYAGVVHISSSDAQASLSADATLTAGIGFFAAALRTAGNQTLTATDTINGSLTGTSAAITVSAGPPSFRGVGPRRSPSPATRELHRHRQGSLQ